jgi:hypothetical protein
MPDPMTGQPMINVKALLKGLLANFPEIRNVDEILNTAPPPMAGVPGMMPGQSPQIGPDGLPLPMAPQQMIGMPSA